MEPYERSAWYVTIVLLIAFLVAMAMGANPATAFGYMFGLLMLVWVSPLFVERIKAKTANHHHVGNIGIKPCFNPKPLAATSDDPDTGPGLMLFTFGGGGGSGFHLKDGGTGFNSGGYFIEPIDAIIEHDGGLTAHPCIFQEVTFDSINPQFQATIMENGYHNTNTIIYQATEHEDAQRGGHHDDEGQRRGPIADSGQRHHGPNGLPNGPDPRDRQHAKAHLQADPEGRRHGTRRGGGAEWSLSWPTTTAGRSK